MKALQCAFRPRRSAKPVKVLGALLSIGVLVFLAQLSFPGCTNADIETFLVNICDAYRKGEISGNLCTHLCSRDISDIQCQNQHIGKDIVFTAIWNSKPVVVKAKKRLITSLDPVYWVDNNKLNHYPDNATFTRMVNSQISYVFRRNSTWVETFYGKQFSIAEMNSIYALLQQTEYLFTLALEGLNVAPKILGTCGHAYAVEFLSPLETRFSSGHRDATASSFKDRAMIALRILNTLDILENAMEEEIHQCDMKSNHFGVDAKGLVKMLDLDAFGLHSTVQANIASSGHCDVDKDCDFFDCAGRCNSLGQCDAVVLNNNLQRICRNVFLGNLFGRYTGLLRSPPSDIATELHALLNECGSMSITPLSRNHSTVIKTKFVELLHSVLVP
ncbi:hypothetical protein V5799_020104 [Amblyomma americanum]|uniref:FAM69 N-terminal domain-containing protein n=1 Tax=Amblyomma americanum TaxID=6943 RepID=A0AAQ4EV01_AMBAM